MRSVKKRNNFKIVKGGPFGLFENRVLCKISKKLKGGPLETLKKFRKAEKGGESITVLEKNWKGGPF